MGNMNGYFIVFSLGFPFSPFVHHFYHYFILSHSNVIEAEAKTVDDDDDKEEL